jgi:hypothetical protein
VTLEIPAYGKNSGVQRYVRHLFPDVSAFSDESCYEDFIEYFVVLGNKFDMSFRALERARSQFLLYTKYRAGLRRFECYFLLGLAVLKVTHPKLFRSIISSTSEIHEMRNLLIDRAFSPSGRHEWKMFTASLAIISIERPSDLSTLPEDTYDAVSSIERLFLLHNVKLVPELRRRAEGRRQPQRRVARHAPLARDDHRHRLPGTPMRRASALAERPRGVRGSPPPAPRPDAPGRAVQW